MISAFMEKTYIFVVLFIGGNLGLFYSLVIHMEEKVQNITIDLIESICEKVARSVNRLSNEREISSLLTDSKIIHPINNSNNAKARISEQEVRYIFAKQIEKLEENIYFSLETPTKNKYNFTGNKATSASTDLTMFLLNDAGWLDRQINVEFKAHNVEYKKYKKDFEKLLVEEYNGLFFQILESVNNGTLNVNSTRKGILVKYNEAVNELKHIFKDEKNKEWFLHFTIYSKKPAFLLSKTFKKEDIDAIDYFFHIEYKIFKNKINLIEDNNWKLINIDDFKRRK
jgi:hypothetical protein